MTGGGTNRLLTENSNMDQGIMKNHNKNYQNSNPNTIQEFVNLQAENAINYDDIKNFF